MMKVCHVTSAHPPEDGRIFRRECTSLAKAGYEVFLVERGDSYIKNGVNIIGFGDVSCGRLQRMTAIAHIAYKTALEVDADIYHLHDPELLPYALKFKQHGKKVIFDSHESYKDQIREKPYIPKSFKKILSELYARYESHVLNHIDGVITPCLKDGQWQLPGKHRATVDNYPWLYEMYDKYDASICKKNSSVCMVGSLTYERGITHFIKAVNRAGAKGYIAGNFHSGVYRSEVLSMPEAESTEFLGYLSREDIFKLISESIVGVAALLNIGQYNGADNLPTKTYEYMSLCVPVILTKAKYNEEVIRKYQFGVCVDPEDIENYANAIRFLIENPDVAKEYGENGRKAVKEIFNWDVEQQKLLTLYREIITS